MRITNNIMTNSFIINLNKNLQNMHKYQQQMTSGKTVSRPSDNPLLVGKILSMKDNIEQNKQYNSNISDTIGWVQTQDTALADVTKTMNRIRDLIIYGSNGVLDDTARNSIKDELEMKMAEIKEVLNTNFDGRYIFAGKKTNTPPFGDNLEYDGSKNADGDNNIKREISQGVTIELLTDGSEITTVGNEKLADFLNKVAAALDDSKPNPDFDPDDPGSSPTVPKTSEEIKEGLNQLSGELLGDTDKFIDNLLRVRSKIGAIHNRLEAAEDRNKTENINLTEVLSDKEDIDLAEKYMEYIMMATNYQASLSVGAKILQPSLVDYLR